MVHYIRFLKTARVEYQTSKSLSVISLITITTDLGDTFLFSDALLTSCLVSAEEPENVLCQDEVHWHRGSRELSLRLHTYVGQNVPLVRLHVFHAQAAGFIPSILDAWSATFELVLGSRATALVERRLSLPSLSTLMIWEETGNSIARHIWDAALGCLLCFQDVGSQSARMPLLSRVLQGKVSGQIDVLELGAGCGIVGIALAHCFSNCMVQLTDLVEAQDILSKNLGQATPAASSSLRGRTLEWNDESGEASLECEFNLIIVSDCIYNPDSCPDLVRTLSRVSSASPDVRILVAAKRRHDSEDVFFDLMRDAQMQILEKTTIDLPYETSDLDVKAPEVELYMYGLE